ncbi:hypothetical protein HMPREF0372_01564 [Flavonifractor plautii ATCC 29863]|uniref:Uncharacterized protein n=1 Tax=Flavonifractor plautii ATCC 29863 TaxID=411475 RepID=G9YPX0_FLAPL|nr:hypothetical protein HMPREF0372_01564 [Flavonifractor plautii ATCC 29863]
MCINIPLCVSCPQHSTNRRAKQPGRDSSLSKSLFDRLLNFLNLQKGSKSCLIQREREP